MELLKYLVHSWNIQAHVFRFGENLLEIQVEDIYFLTGLSKRGAPVSLLGGRSGGEIVKDYIATYCRPRALPTRDGKINRNDVTQLPLRMILFIIAILVGSSALHVVRKSYMQYGIECLEPTIFN